MSDRSSPEIYGTIFRMLASDPSHQHVKWAKKLWKHSFQFDFSTCEMNADSALKKLGLAKFMVDPDFPDDGKQYLYADERGKFFV